MTRAAWRWAAILVTADAVVWLLTLNAQSAYHSAAGGPSTTLGIVIGWIASIGLLLALVLTVLGGRQAKSYQRRR